LFFNFFVKCMSTVQELVSFGLKPGNCLVFNCPVRQLADGAIYVREFQGFSHIFLIVGTFLDQTQISNVQYPIPKFKYSKYFSTLSTSSYTT